VTKKELHFGGRDIVLMGTAHISQQSLLDVENGIREMAPDFVAIELDDQRLAAMQNPDSWKNLDIVKVLKEGQGLVLLANLMLASFQRRMGANVGTKPGAEMEAAFNTSKGLSLKTVMIDRPIKVTLRRAWAKNSLWGKCKLLSALVSGAFSTETVSSEEVENLKNGNEMDTMMNDLASYLPAVKSVLIDERDCFLASRIWEIGDGKTFAVLGAGHLPGVASHLEKLAAGTESSDTTAIESVPPPGLASRLLGLLFPVAILALIVAGFVKGGATLSGAMLLRWLLWNGSLAAIATLAAGGHVLTVIAAFVGAPIGTLSPVLSVGVFAGLVQAWVKKPKVADLETIHDDVSSLKGIYRNRLLRILLIFFVSSIGGVIGNIIAVPGMWNSLFR
jgi:pheromone shutdown-related protein TraB